jgi:hypothetical protein
LLIEITKTNEIISYVHFLCESFFDQSIVRSYFSVFEFCSKIVEPFCSRLEQSAASGIVPIFLQQTLIAVQTNDNFSFTTAKNLLSEFIVPHVLSFFSKKVDQISAFNPQLTLNEASEEKKIFSLNLKRLKSLFYECFDVNSDNTQFENLSLSETAALSRSRWYLGR